MAKLLFKTFANPSLSCDTVSISSSMREKNQIKEPWQNLLWDLLFWKKKINKKE